MRRWIVCDLDGTLCNHTHRLDYLRRKPREFDNYHNCLLLDPIHEDVENLIHLLKREGYWIGFCTGRPIRYWDETRAWLNKYGLNDYKALMMRKRNDKRSDIVIKPELLAGLNINPENTSFILEDRNRMVDTWRAMGYTCFQVRNGDY